MNMPNYLPTEAEHAKNTLKRPQIIAQSFSLQNHLAKMAPESPFLEHLMLGL